MYTSSIRLLTCLKFHLNTNRRFSRDLKHILHFYNIVIAFLETYKYQQSYYREIKKIYKEISIKVVLQNLPLATYFYI